MLKTAAVLLLLLTLPGASVRERFGQIEYIGADGVTRTLIRDGTNGDPVLSPDGRTVAFIRVEREPDEEHDNGIRTLWIGDGPNGTSRRLAAPHSGSDPTQEFMSVGGPIFSLDGGFVYVSAAAWATSEAVHQVNVATGSERYVIDGWILSVIRTGPYRGYLLVQRHRYLPPPSYGSNNPVFVVRPDAKQVFMVPGSDKDDGEKSVGAWLKAKGWQAW